MMSVLWSIAVLGTVCVWRAIQNIRRWLLRLPVPCPPASVRWQGLSSRGMWIEDGFRKGVGSARWLSIIWWTSNCCLPLHGCPATQLSIRLPFRTSTALWKNNIVRMAVAIMWWITVWKTVPYAIAIRHRDMRTNRRGAVDKLGVFTVWCCVIEKLLADALCRKHSA